MESQIIESFLWIFYFSIPFMFFGMVAVILAYFSRNLVRKISAKKFLEVPEDTDEYQQKPKDRFLFIYRLSILAYILLVKLISFLILKFCIADVFPDSGVLSVLSSDIPAIIIALTFRVFPFVVLLIISYINPPKYSLILAAILAFICDNWYLAAAVFNPSYILAVPMLDFIEPNAVLVCIIVGLLVGVFVWYLKESYFQKHNKVAKPEKALSYITPILVLFIFLSASVIIWISAPKAKERAKEIRETYRSNDSGSKADSTLKLSIDDYKSGMFDDALKELRQSLEYSRKDKYLDLEAKALRDMGNVYLSLGDLQEANDCFKQSMDISIKIGQPWQKAANFCRIGETLFYQGNFEKAEDDFERALAIYDSIGSDMGRAWVSVNIAKLLINQKRSSEAETILLRLSNIHADIDDSLESVIYLEICKVKNETKEFDSEKIDSVLAKLLAVKIDRESIGAYRAVAELLFEIGEIDQATQICDTANSYAKGYGMKEELKRCEELLTRMHSKTG